MEEASQQFLYPCSTRGGARAAISLPRVVVHFAVESATTVTWRIAADSELRVHGQARLWLTRHCSPYDYWLQPGESISLERGERVWLSVEDQACAEVSITSPHVERHRMLRRWLARWRERVFDIGTARRGR
ncbi:DUF2917 domain-containing protein [Paraburkholderia sprentiae WSM5005]|uniref:DUF2917 domain-containing protein n=1 Tax=Paraburkholderia sprentiae WSM5005 TaxID=754502 RepID=A0A1I9YH03_9BURK|nr:DUF2917 domain-containing protein [Paraburkholderia sprentiae]APA85586.1 DUF2917 domain-containing protein [Paraburkholderia sprentiae WSM5005]